jgi:predicted NAD/FAD-binding protein
MSDPVTFFEGFDSALRNLICGAMRLAKRKRIAPSEVTAALVTSLVGRAFDVAVVAVGPEKAAKMICDHAPGALSNLQFGEHEGEA